MKLEGANCSVQGVLAQGSVLITSGNDLSFLGCDITGFSDTLPVLRLVSGLRIRLSQTALLSVGSADALTIDAGVTYGFGAVIIVAGSVTNSGAEDASSVVLGTP
jgi:hypothetical protein